MTACDVVGDVVFHRLACSVPLSISSVRAVVVAVPAQDKEEGNGTAGGSQRTTALALRSKTAVFVADSHLHRTHHPPAKTTFAVLTKRVQGMGNRAAFLLDLLRPDSMGLVLGTS